MGVETLCVGFLFDLVSLGCLSRNVVVSPLPCCGVMSFTKCPVIVAGFCLASQRCGSGLWTHSPNYPGGFSSRLILLCICIYGPSEWACVMTSLIPCCGRMISSNCALIIPGALSPAWMRIFPRPFLQIASGEVSSNKNTVNYFNLQLYIYKKL